MVELVEEVPMISSALILYEEPDLPITRMDLHTVTARTQRIPSSFDKVILCSHNLVQ